MEQREADDIRQSSRLSPQTEEEIRNHIELLKDELPGCRLSKCTDEAISAYNQRENSLIEKYERWLSEFKYEVAKKRK